MARLATLLLTAYPTVALIVCGLLALPAHANDGLVVTENRVKADFPNSVTFYLSVEGQARIDDIELEYGLTHITCGPASAKARPEFEPTANVKVSWTWDFRKSGSPPPGARIWWRWYIEDKAGSALEVAEQEFFLDDPRYEWTELLSEELALHSALPDERVNQALWETANQALERLEMEVGASPSGRITIYNYPSTQDLRDARVHVRDWTGGLAISAYETILLGVNQANLEWGERTVAHELTHIVVDQLTFNCLGDIPTWLDEGLATYIEGGLEDHQQVAFDEALASDGLATLQSLSSSFPTSSKAANLAYAQSHQVVSYLIETYGSEKMRPLLDTFRAGSTGDQALQIVYGLDTNGLENEWRVCLGLSPRQVVARTTPTPRPTLAPYGASSPTAIPSPRPTTTPASTATRSPTPQLTRGPAAPLMVQKTTPTIEPTVTLTPALIATPAASTRMTIISPLVLVFGGIVFLGVVTSAVLWLRRLA